nr:ribonuclease H-like domain-containing protein [Tanacetum cinerariifolium]
MRADRFWKKTGKKITIQGSDVAGFDISKVECFNCHKMGYFARECRSPRSQDRWKRESYKNDLRVLERDIELKDNKIEYLRNEIKEVKKEKESTDFKIENFENASKDLDRLLESQKLDKDMKGVGFNEYCVVPPPPAQVYSPPKKDLSWMGLPEFVDDTVTDYTRPTPSIDVSKSGIPQDNIDDKGYWNSGCSRHMTGNISYLSKYEPFNGGYVSFGHGRGKITGRLNKDRGTTTQDCYKLYDEEKNKLLNVIQKNIGRGIDAIMHVSVDNASANDSAIDFLRKTFAKKDNCLLNGKLDSHHMHGSYFESCSARWQQTEMASIISAQDLEIYSLKARIQLLKDKDKGTAELSGDDAPIKGRSLETGEEAGVERSTERGSNDTEELVNVLTFMDAANILTSGVQAVSVPPIAKVSTIDVPTGSGLVPTVSAIFTTSSVVTPYSRRKGMEKMVESDTPKKKKLQEQIDVQMAREIEEQMAREDQMMDEQIERDAEIARIHEKKSCRC